MRGLCDVLQRVGVGRQSRGAVGSQVFPGWGQSSPSTFSLALYPIAFNGARSGESEGRANSPLCAEDPEWCLRARLAGALSISDVFIQAFSHVQASCEAPGVHLAS